MIYRRGKYQVEISDDGLVKVKQGDWLSKYAIALGNDLGFIHEFRRLDPAGRVVPIQDLNLIRAGETLVFLPFYTPKQAIPSPRVQPPSRPKPVPPRRALTEQEKQKIKETIKKDFKLRGEHWSAASKVIDYVGYADGGMTVLEIAGVLAEGGVAAGAATALSLLSPFLGMIGGVIGVVNAWEFGLRLYGLRAAAYGTTAWAFGHPRPAMPTSTAKNLRHSGRPQDLPKYERAWTEAVDAACSELDLTVAKKGIQKASLQKAYQAIGDGEPKKLARILLAAMRDEYCSTPNEKHLIWSPEPDYPTE